MSAQNFSKNLRLYPSVGVARLGNSPTDICLSPDTIGGLPFEAQSNGDSSFKPVTTFKDTAGLIKRQGQLFKIFDDTGAEVVLGLDNNIESIVWTVHLASKKAAWYQYSELQGNLLYGSDNSYAKQGVALRNPDVPDEKRQTLIVDPGPRQISGRHQSKGLDADTLPTPTNYPVQYPPKKVVNGIAVTTLGDLITDSSGRLIVLGGFGHAGGIDPLTSYGGSSTWHDDISDGSVSCTVTFTDGTTTQLSAWVVVGSPDFAPEIVNISNLSDTMFDVGVRCFDLVPEMCVGGVYKSDFKANFKRDILPIIQRIGRYQWVANVQPMMAFTQYQFDYSDNSESNKKNRQTYLSYFRQPDTTPPNLYRAPIVEPTQPDPTPYPQEVLFKKNVADFFPMMPVNSGSNSVSNVNIMKFMALDQTQLFLLGQWANGRFDNNEVPDSDYPVSPLDAASVGNCVGLPMCPGIEVTWNLQNPIVYETPYNILQCPVDVKNGLTPSRDECDPSNTNRGCEPGDLTKRMACPWQADFFQCTVQYINFTDQYKNKHWDVEEKSMAPLPPTYYSYWWPPQSPWDVLVGETTEEGQALTHVPAGQQMNYARGINSFSQMVEYWHALGFIRDMNSSGEGFPFMLETERSNELFSYQAVPVSNVSFNPDDDETTIPVFFIEKHAADVKQKSAKATLLMDHLEEVGFKAISIASGGLGLPRSGTRNRR